jgi:hypothetical protein
MSCCRTKIVQLSVAGGGAGPFTVQDDVPGLGQVTVTDTASGNSFVIPAADNIYNANGTLTGNRVVNNAGFDITFQGGGDFIIDGKLTVTGIIDPTGLQFTGGVQADAGMPNGTIYVTDGSASGFPSGEIIFKDFTGVYARLENTVAASSILSADFVQAANRAQDFAGFSQVWNNMSVFTRNNVDGNEQANFTSLFIPTLSNVVQHNAGGSNITVTDTGSLAKLVVSNNPELSYTLGSNNAGYFVKLGGVGSALGIPQLYVNTAAVDVGAAVVGQVLTLDSVTGEAEFRDAAAAIKHVALRNKAAGVNSAPLQTITPVATVSWDSVVATSVINLGAGFITTNTLVGDVTVGATSIAINTAGVYEINATILGNCAQFDADVMIYLRKSGGFGPMIAAAMATHRPAGNPAALQASYELHAVEPLAVGQVVDMWVASRSGAATSFEITMVSMSIKKVG